MSNTLRNYRGSVNYKPSAVNIGIGGDPIFIARGNAADGVHLKTYAMETAQQEVALDQLKSIPSWNRLNKRIEQLDNPLLLHSRTEQFADSQSQLQRDQQLLGAVEFLESDEEASELAEDLVFIGKNKENLDNEEIRVEMHQRIGKWTTNPATGMYFENTATVMRTAMIERIQEQIAFDLTPAIETAIAVQHNRTRAGWLEAIGHRNAETQQAIANDAQQLRKDLLPALPLNLALATYLTNAKVKAGNLHVIYVPDVQGAFADQTPTIIELIGNLQKSFVDVIPTESVSESMTKTFIDALGTDLHASLYLSFTNYSNAQQLRRNVPKGMATTAAGNVHMVAGKGTIGNFTGIPMAAAVAGLRRRIDGMVSSKMYGLFEPTFARKGPKELLGFDEVDSFAWPIQMAMDLATESQCNAFIMNPTTNVATLALDRSRSTLTNKTQFAANRALQILLGAIRMSLSVELVSSYDDAEVIREHLRLTDETFLKPYRHTPGFEARITHSGGLAPGIVGLALKYLVNSPVESFQIEVDSDPG
ncbi:MAG: hypothetical protein CME32_07290 [Gimesia sp.]|nr:hypothetical protein [Gimesia sp.]